MIHRTGVLTHVRMNSELTQAKPTNPCDAQNAALDLLARAGQVLDRAGVEYSLCDGTLLGLIRNGDFIVGDNDIDLRVPRAALNAALIGDMEQAGISWSKQAFVENTLVNLSFRYKNIRLDLSGRVPLEFGPESRPESRGNPEGWETSHFRFRSGYLTSRLPYRGREKTQFGGVDTWRPCHSQDLLAHCYGADWCQPVTRWDHFFNYGALVSLTGDAETLKLGLRRWLAAQGHPAPPGWKRAKTPD